MKRALGRLLAIAATSLLITLSAVTPAHASGEYLGCRIAPGTVFTFEQFCDNSTASAYTYYVAFAVQNLSGTGHGFSWAVSGAPHTVYSGCTSTSATCTVAVRRGAGDVQVVGSVTVYFATGGSAGFDSYATIMPWCGDYLC